MNTLTKNFIVKNDRGLTYNGQFIKVASSAGHLMDALLWLDEKNGCKCQYEKLVCERTGAPMLRITAKNGHNELWAYIDDVRNVQTTGDGE